MAIALLVAEEEVLHRGAGDRLPMNRRLVRRVYRRVFEELVVDVQCRRAARIGSRTPFIRGILSAGSAAQPQHLHAHPYQTVADESEPPCRAARHVDDRSLSIVASVRPAVDDAQDDAASVLEIRHAHHACRAAASDAPRPSPADRRSRRSPSLRRGSRGRTMTPARPARRGRAAETAGFVADRSTSVTAVSTATRHQPRELHAHVVIDYPH